MQYSKIFLYVHIIFHFYSKIFTIIFNLENGEYLCIHINLMLIQGQNEPRDGLISRRIQVFNLCGAHHHVQFFSNGLAVVLYCFNLHLVNTMKNVFLSVEEIIQRRSMQLNMRISYLLEEEKILEMFFLRRH